jgi:hypothetical protein
LGINGSINLHNSSETNGRDILESSLNSRVIQSKSFYTSPSNFSVYTGIC